jgi:hypothetical protein
MEMLELPKNKPLLWIGIALLVILFCCCCVIVTLALLEGPLQQYMGG